MRAEIVQALREGNVGVLALAATLVIVNLGGAAVALLGWPL